MTSHTRFHTLLIFPPVWTPATPYLALPVLMGYLKEKGYEASQWDASLDFLTSHLFTPETLKRLKSRLIGLADEHEKTLPKDALLLINDLNNGASGLARAIQDPQALLDLFRSEESFFDPDTLVRAQRDVYGILRMVSLAHWPLRMTFNKYFHQIDSFPAMVDHCDDQTNNLFLPFYEKAASARIQDDTRLVGISVSTAQQLVGALTLARWIKKRHPHIHVTLGGKHLIRLKEAFTKYPEYVHKFCDSLIMDNGERPLEELIQALLNGSDFSRVSNLVYSRGETLLENPTCPREPLSLLPTPDFSDLPLSEYLSPTPLIPLRVSEGCYWGKCSFCARYYLTGFSTIPPVKVAEQMVEIQTRYGANHFTVNDDCLTPRYLEELSREIINRGLDIRISLWLKPVHTFSKERLRLLHQAGVRLVRWGLETGHERILKLMNKGTRIPDTLQVLKDASDAGIWNHGCIILGFPTETREEAQATVDFLTDHKDIIHSSILYQFVLLDHSYIFNHPDEYSITSIETHGNVFSNTLRYETDKGMPPSEFQPFYELTRKRMRENVYQNPFWYHARVREYLFLYVSRYGKDEVARLKIDPETSRISGSCEHGGKATL